MIKLRHLFRHKALLLTLPLFLMSGIGLFWQITITGKIVSGTDNQSLTEVNVFVKGKTTATITDIDENYSIEVPDSKVI